VSTRKSTFILLGAFAVRTKCKLAMEAKTYDLTCQKIYLKVLQDAENNKTLYEKDGSASILEAGKGLEPLNVP